MCWREASVMPSLLSYSVCWSVLVRRCVYVCMRRCVYVWMCVYVCMCVCLYVCMCGCVDMCITDTWLSWREIFGGRGCEE